MASGFVLFMDSLCTVSCIGFLGCCGTLNENKCILKMVRLLCNSEVDQWMLNIFGNCCSFVVLPSFSYWEKLDYLLWCGFCKMM